MTIPKPCPFCGNKNVAVVEGSTFRWRACACAECGAIGPEVRMQTSGTGTREEWENKAKADAVAAWNERALIGS